MSSCLASREGATAASRQSNSQHTTAIPAASAAHDFHSVTCVTWSASGRNLGIGTPGGLILYSTEPLVSTLSGSSIGSAPLPGTISTRTSNANDSATLQEVCRCAVYGGVGQLSLYKQCSVVALTGVQRCTAAARLQLVDVSQSPPSTYFTCTTAAAATTAKTSVPSLPVDGAAAISSRAARPWPADEDSAVAQWYEQWRVSAFANTTAPPSTVAVTLAYAECPTTVAALQFCPQVVIAASSGDPRINGSHTLYVFDHHLRPLYTLPVYPPSSNAHLKDMIAIAAAFTSSNGAGMMVQRLRVLLPGEKKGEVRLLTLKKSTLTAAAYDTPVAAALPNIIDGKRKDIRTVSHASRDNHRLVDRVLHQAPLRAVAIADDGRSGVTMSVQGIRLRLLDFVGDDIIHERLSLDRGRLPAVTDTVSLAIAPVRQLDGSHGFRRNSNIDSNYQQQLRSGVTAGGDVHKRYSSTAAYADLPNRQFQQYIEALHDVVICLTSSGTMHIYGCGLQQVLFYHTDKTLLPRVGYPYGFSVCLPSQLVRESGITIFVVRSDMGTSAARYLPRREQRRLQGGGKAVADEELVASLPSEFFAFQLRYPTTVLARDVCETTVGSGDVPCSSLFVCCCLTV